MAKTTTQSPKVISDPIYGIIDVRSVLPMIDTREFQALDDKRQLGMSYLTFPSATHTRKAHSIGAYHATRELTERWLKRGFVNQREADALAAFALYHDIGHPPFSHVTEPLCATPRNIKNMSTNAALSLEIIRRRKKNIEACGVDTKLVESFAEHKNPLHLAVSDKNLGMEKLDYLERDGLFTILSRPVGVDYLRSHIYFIDNELAIDEKAVDNAIEIQNYYLKIYKNVYLRKASAIAQRMMQKMVHQLIQRKELSSAELIDLTDSELIGTIRNSKSDMARTLYEMLRTRNLFREAIVIRPESFEHAATRAGKNIAIFGATKNQIQKIAKDKVLGSEKDQAGLETFEKTIAEIAKIPEEHILVVPLSSTDRFEAKDIKIYTGPKQKLASLKARYPAHFKNIEEVAQSYLAFRVCTTEKYRARLANPKIAKQVLEIIL